jgi:hypothetical protein
MGTPPPRGTTSQSQSPISRTQQSLRRATRSSDLHLHTLARYLTNEICHSVRSNPASTYNLLEMTVLEPRSLPLPTYFAPRWRCCNRVMGYVDVQDVKLNGG